MQVEKIQSWLIRRLADELEISTGEVDPSVSFERYGVDSVSAASMVGDLELWLKREFDASLLLRHPTIDALAKFLADGDARSNQGIEVSN